MLANFSEETLTVPKHTDIRIAQQISEELIDKINAESGSDSERLPRNRKNEALCKKQLPGKLNHLRPEDRIHTEPILIKFHDEKERDFKCTNVVKHQIQMCDVKPIIKTPYRILYALRQERQNQVQKGA